METLKYIFECMYCWFEDLFGDNLGQYLYGHPDLGQESMFLLVGVTMLAITLFVIILFYYIINHPKMNNWWCWLIFMAGNAIVNFIVGWQWVLTHFYEGLMVDADGEQLENITEEDIVCFGVSNMILSILVFVILTYILKWWSTNCSKAPF